MPSASTTAATRPPFLRPPRCGAFSSVAPPASASGKPSPPPPRRGSQDSRCSRLSSSSSLFQHQLGLSVSDPAAALLHGLTGIAFYPIGYLLLTRIAPRLGLNAAGWIWGVATYFIALGFFAPLAGQSFLLRDVPALSFMSLVGHAIYGWLAAIVFDALERAATPERR